MEHLLISQNISKSYSKFEMERAKVIGTSMSPTTKLDKDENGKPVDSNVYRGMISSL